jgi:allantoin racemase
MRIKQIIPFPISGADLEGRMAHIPRHYLNDHTIVDTIPVRNSFSMSAPAMGTSFYEWALLEMYVLEAGVTASEEGYDAVVVDSTTDSAVRALRSRLSIPVIGCGVASYSMALALGPRFSIITYTDEHRFLSDESLRSYGLERMCASIRAIGQLPVIEGASAEVIEDERLRFVAAGRAAVEDGADSIILGSTVMHKAAATLAAELPVPVLDPGPLGIALAELIVAFDLRHAETSYPSPQLIQDAILHALPSARRDDKTVGSAENISSTRPAAPE